MTSNKVVQVNRKKMQKVVDKNIHADQSLNIIVYTDHNHLFETTSKFKYLFEISNKTLPLSFKVLHLISDIYSKWQTIL